MPTALVTGVTGQDGSYLAEFLLEQGYRVIGMVRRTSTINFSRLEHIQDHIEIAQGDLLDQMSLTAILNEYKPDEVYNLAAQSFVPTSFSQPVLTGEFTALGVTVWGVSTQTTQHQDEFRQRNHVPFHALSDHALPLSCAPPGSWRSR